MHNIYIAGTGIWYPEDKILNDELVNSYMPYQFYHHAHKMLCDHGQIFFLFHYQPGQCNSEPVFTLET